MRKILIAPVLALLALAATEAHAIPVSYSIHGNGIYGNPVGSFTYDTTSNVYSNVSIWSLDYYSSATGNAQDRLLRSTGALGTILRLTFSGPLTDAGGNISFSGYEQGVLTLFGRVSRVGEVAGGGGTASVPEPGALLLLSAGLFGLALVRRRAASKAP